MKIICSKCKVPKKRKEFSFHGKGKLKSHCKECQRKMSAEHYRKNKHSYIEQAKTRNRSYLERNRQMLYEYLCNSDGCEDCGEKDPIVLDFDHLSNKVDNVATLALQALSWSTILKEIEKCEIVCANCHRKRTAKRSNSFRHRYAIVAPM